jgi:hypothetical protein
VAGGCLPENTDFHVSIFYTLLVLKHSKFIRLAFKPQFFISGLSARRYLIVSQI